MAASARAAAEIRVRLETANGLSIHGEGRGRYGIDPTILVHTARDLEQRAK